MGAVEDYFSYYGARQWEDLRKVFDHSDFERSGYNDFFVDADKYVDFLEETVPALGSDYELHIERIVQGPAEMVAVGQFTEHLEFEGVVADVPETLIFDLNDDGLIRRISLYIKKPGGHPAVGGAGAAEG